MDFLSELRWRHLIQEITPGTEEYLQSGQVRGYIGFDPTAPSLTIGNYVQIMLLILFQRAGHQPVVLMGGATGRIGDPSGRDTERDLKSIEELERNIAHQQAQFQRLLDFSEDRPNRALLLDNYAFYADMNVLDFLREVGKHLTVNYMMSKESVQRRIESGISFTEFSYQLLQGYDFVLLHRRYGIALQMGGSDQYGNITTGIELARKIDGQRLYAIVSPLLTKADGTKFGKSTGGNIWLDPNLTSPYRFYQFWINADDRDVPKLLRYFSLKSREEIEALDADPIRAKRVLAEELTTRIHGADEYVAVQAVSALLFDPKADAEALHRLSEKALTQIAEEIPAPQVPIEVVQNHCNIVDFLSEHAHITTSRSDARRAIQGNAISVNKKKITSLDYAITPAHLLHGRYLLVENGRKNKYLVQLITA